MTKEKPTNRKILTVIRDMETSFSVNRALKLDGYNVLLSHDEITGIEKARLEKPDLIIIDSIVSGVDGSRIAQKLKGDPITRFVPIILLIELADALTGKTSAFTTEAYVIKPFNPETLKTDISRLLKITYEQLSANPLTKLPGSISIEEDVNKRIKNKEPFAVAYLDINDFKPFNDFYGFYRGDLIIKFLAETLTESSRVKGEKTDLVGHIAADDFVLVTIPDKIDPVINEVIQVFDGSVLRFYNKEDLDRGYITVEDRSFQTRNFPVMSLSIAAMTNEKRDIAHYGKVIDILVEVKKFLKAKKLPNKSCYLKDRRKADL